METTIVYRGEYRGLYIEIMEKENGNYYSLMGYIELKPQSVVLIACCGTTRREGLVRYSLLQATGFLKFDRMDSQYPGLKIQLRLPNPGS